MRSTMFDMGAVMNRLRTIAEAGPDTLNQENPQQSTTHHDPGMEKSGHEISNASFTRTMQRLSAIKDAVSEEHFHALRAGVRALYMNRRPNLEEMSALMDLLETMLSYVSEDNALFQRLKNDLAQDEKNNAKAQDTATPAGPAGTQPTDTQEIGAPSTATPVKQPTMRDLKV